MGLVLTVLEGDPELVINSLKNESFSLASFGHLIQDANFLPSFYVILIRFPHVHCEGNSVAHNFARHVPPHNVVVIQADLAIVT